MLLAVVAGAAEPTDDFERAAESCRSLPFEAQGDCMQRLAAAAREPAAGDVREDELRRATRSYHLRLADALARSGRPRELAFAATLRSLASKEAPAPPAPNNGSASQPIAVDPQVVAWRRVGGGGAPPGCPRQCAVAGCRFQHRQQRDPICRGGAMAAAEPTIWRRGQCRDGDRIPCWQPRAHRTVSICMSMTNCAGSPAHCRHHPHASERACCTVGRA